MVGEAYALTTQLRRPLPGLCQLWRDELIDLSRTGRCQFDSLITGILVVDPDMFYDLPVNVASTRL